MKTTTRVVVPYIGGTAEERGRSLIHEDPASLVEGRVQEYYPVEHGTAAGNADRPDVVERYVLTLDGDRWIWRYEGTHERPLRERLRRLQFVGGPLDGTLSKELFASALTPEPQFPTAGHHTAAWWRKNVLGEHGAEYELRHDGVVGQYWQYTR